MSTFYMTKLRRNRIVVLLDSIIFGPTRTRELQDLDIYRQLFLNASEGLILTNKKGEIIEVNPKACLMFGYKSDELIGNRIEVLVPQDKRKGHESHRKDYHDKPTNRSMGIQ